MLILAPSDFNRLISGYRLASPYPDRLVGGSLPHCENKNGNPTQVWVNPFRAPKPLPILNPSDFVARQRVSSCKE